MAERRVSHLGMPSSGSETGLAAALDCVDVGVLTVDGGLRVSFANAACRRLLDLPSMACAAGAGLPDLLRTLAERGDLGLGDIEAVVERSLAPVRAGLRHATVLRRRNGQRTAIDGAPLGDGGYIHTVTDVTAQHLANEALRVANRASVLALADLAEFRDTDTGDHVVRVSRLVHEIARAMRAGGTLTVADPESLCEQVAVASMLHDIGKVTVADGILRKPGPLDPEERRMMQLHSIEGHRLLAKAAAISPAGSHLALAAEIARSHHERTDGAGYPDGLAGEAIPIAARIVAVADVFDALNGERPYKQAWPEEKAVAYIRDNAGTQFDPAVVAAFLDVLAERAKTPVIRWEPEMSVGNPQLDRDHRVLIGLVNQLAHENSLADRVMLDLVLDELAGYVASHFAREEEYMAAIGFVSLDLHRAQHRGLSRELDDLRLAVAEGRTPPAERLHLFLANWLRRHILVEDMRYARAVAEAAG